MLALTVMSVAAFALLAAASRCVAAGRSTRDYHNAVGILDLALLEHPLILTNEVFENEVESEEYGSDSRYTFSRSVEKTEDEDDRNMFVVTTRIAWLSKGRDKFEEVVTYIYSTNHPDYEP